MARKRLRTAFASRSRWSTLRGRLEVAFAVLVVLFGLNVGAVLWAASVRDDARHRVAERLTPARLGVEQLLAAYLNQETGERGYALTGDAVFLQPYDLSVAAAKRLTTSLAAQLSGEPVALAALGRLEAAARDWRQQAALPEIAGRRAGSRSAAEVTADALRAKALFDRARTDVDQLRDQVSSVSNRVSAAEARDDAWLGRITVVTFAVAFGFVVFVFALLRRSLTRPLEGLVASISAVARGNLEHAVTTVGPVEFELLADSAEQMRIRLVTEASKALQSSLVIAQEEERRRIAADIHDDSVQALTAVSLRLQRLRRRLGGDEAAMLRDAEVAATVAIGRLRRLIFELHPPTLDDEGLVAALRLYAAETYEGVAWDVDGDLGVEPGRAAQALAYRVSREALINVAKHARCKRVSVDVGRRSGGLHVQVVDDGVGFDPVASARVAPGHLGLVGADRLVRAAGGWWRVRSSPGQGTTVEFWLPDTVGADDLEARSL